jgi:hypothetical protein
MMTRGSRLIFFLLYVIFGLYFINSGLNFWPALTFPSIEKWIQVVAGALILLGGINYYRASRYSGY